MKILLSILTSFVLFTACKTDKKIEVSNDITTSVEEDFTDFYKRFMRDSTYQLAHIDFPLAGLPEQMDSISMADGKFAWTAENWVLHQTFVSGTNGFDVKFNWLSETLIEEQLLNKKIGLGMMRRFSKGRDGWFLIYYAGMNRVSHSK